VAEGAPVAVITGGTRGIGLAIARRLAADGFDMLISYLGDEEAAKQAEKELENVGRRVDITAADVSVADGSGALIETAMSTFGRIDVLINNAGITRDTLVMRMGEDDWDAVLNTNLKGAFLCAKAAIRPMIRQRSGRIVNMTSVVGLVGNAGQANYASAKAGLVGLTKSLAKEVGSRGITVNAVAPGFIETRLTAAIPVIIRQAGRRLAALGQGGEPRDVAEVLTFLSTPGAAGLTGAIVRVCGGALIGA